MKKTVGTLFFHESVRRTFLLRFTDNITIEFYRLLDLIADKEHMKAKKKKDPNDYPLLAVRMPEDVKTEILAEVKRVQKVLNTPLKDSKTEQKFRMNDIIIEALRKGLKQIKSREDKWWTHEQK